VRFPARTGFEKISSLLLWSLMMTYLLTLIYSTDTFMQNYLSKGHQK